MIPTGPYTITLSLLILAGLCAVVVALVRAVRARHRRDDDGVEHWRFYGDE